jgi:hypothetical protein
MSAVVLGSGDLLQNAFNKIVGPDSLGFRFIGKQDPMAQDTGSDLFDVVWDHESALLQKSMRACSAQNA